MLNTFNNTFFKRGILLYNILLFDVYIKIANASTYMCLRLSILSKFDIVESFSSEYSNILYPVIES